MFAFLADNSVNASALAERSFSISGRNFFEEPKGFFVSDALNC